jgi:serine/threonine-protein kinase
LTEWFQPSFQFIFQVLCARVITITLLHPIQSNPVQSWTFEDQPVIRIGRATDNHVILYSAVVSRHHVELRHDDKGWEIVNLGANGTYLEGKRINQVSVEDGVIIRLARSGPNLRVFLGKPGGQSTTGSSSNIRNKPTLPEAPSGSPVAQAEQPAVVHKPITSQPRTDLDQPTDVKAPVELQSELEAPAAPAPPVEASPVRGAVSPTSPAAVSAEASPVAEEQLPDGRRATDRPASQPPATPQPQPWAESACTHPRARAGMLFCIDCGQPLQVLQTVGPYAVVKQIKQVGIGATYLAWSQGQRYLLQGLAAEWAKQAVAAELFRQEASQLLTLHHASLPKFVEVVQADDQFWLVLEEVRGQNLKQLVASQGPLSAAAAIALMQQICQVLEYLHQQSPPLVHQDIQPENLVRSVGDPQTVLLTGLLSFHCLEPHASTAPTGYLAPEVQQGEALTASDLFALGPTLVYLVTGQSPELFYAQGEQGYRFYPESVPGLPTELVPIVRKLTNPLAEERYPTAHAVAEAFQQLSGQS